MNDLLSLGYLQQIECTSHQYDWMPSCSRTASLNTVKPFVSYTNLRIIFLCHIVTPSVEISIRTLLRPSIRLCQLSHVPYMEPDQLITRIVCKYWRNQYIIYLFLTRYEISQPTQEALLRHTAKSLFLMYHVPT